MSDVNDAVLTERRGRVLLITLNRPEAMNAINGALSRGLVAACAELDGDAGLTAAVLTGASSAAPNFTNQFGAGVWSV